MAAPWMPGHWMAVPASHFADFIDKSRLMDGHFAVFGQVKNWPYSKTPEGETGCLSNFLGNLSMPPALHPGFSDLLRSPPALRSTLTTFDCLLFLIVQASSFLIHPLSQHSQLGYLWLPTPHCVASLWLTGHHAVPSLSLIRFSFSFFFIFAFFQ